MHVSTLAILLLGVAARVSAADPAPTHEPRSLAFVEVPAVTRALPSDVHATDAFDVIVSTTSIFVDEAGPVVSIRDGDVAPGDKEQSTAHGITIPQLTSVASNAAKRRPGGAVIAIDHSLSFHLLEEVLDSLHAPRSTTSRRCSSSCGRRATASRCSRSSCSRAGTSRSRKPGSPRRRHGRRGLEPDAGQGAREDPSRVHRVDPALLHGRAEAGRDAGRQGRARLDGQSWRFDVPKDARGKPTKASFSINLKLVAE